MAQEAILLGTGSPDTAPIDTSRARRIFADQPQDVEYEEITPPQLNPDDFSQAPPEPKPEGKTPEEEPEEVETEEVPDKETPEEKRRRTKSDEVREKVVKVFIKPRTIIIVLNMVTSRGGSMILIRSKREDWALDSYEKEVLTELLEAWIEEDGVHFWPARVWLIIALVFIFAFKGVDVWTMYYSKSGKLKHAPQEAIERFNEEYSVKVAELDRLTKEVDLERKRASLKRELQKLRDEQSPLYDAFHEPTNGNGHAEPKTQKKPVSPNLHSYKHPYTNKFMTKEKYEEFIDHIMNGGEWDRTTGDIIPQEGEKEEEEAFIPTEEA